MDPDKNKAETKHKVEDGNVVVLISDEQQKLLRRPESSSSNHTSVEIGSSTPPMSPSRNSNLRRHTLTRSVFSKPKSRFFDQPQPSIHATDEAIKISPTPSKATEDEEEEEDEEKVLNFERRSKKRISKRGFLRRFTEWLILILAGGLLIASLIVDKLKGVEIWGLEIWKWCVMVVVIFCGRLFTYWFVFLVVFLIERNFIFKRNVLYFVYGLKQSFRFCLWFALILIAWVLLFNQGVNRSEKTRRAQWYVTRALISLLVGSVMWLVKTLLVKMLAASFHVNRFFDRIQEAVFNQYILQTLLGPPLTEQAKKFGHEECKPHLSFEKVRTKNGEQQKGKIDVARLQKIRQEKVSAWTMKGLVSFVSSGFLTISNSIDDIRDDDGGGKQDEDMVIAWEETVVNQIFKNVAKPWRKYIEEADLLRFLTTYEVEIFLSMFVGPTNAKVEKIKRKALKNWVLKAYLDRKTLVHSLNDTKTTVKQVHKIASVIVFVFIIIVTLLVMEFATTKFLVVISSQLVLVAFMFGNTAKTVFEGIIFVFAMHPFDVGDRCVVDGVQMNVEEMNLLTTVFLKYDKEKIYYPNAVLATKPISNFFRSPEMGDAVEFSIGFSTSVETIAALKGRIKSYIESKPKYWQPAHSIVVKDIVDVNKMNFALYLTHTMNFQDFGEKTDRRTELVMELKKILEDLSIRYNLLPQDVRLTYASNIQPPLSTGR